jgi:glycosyltransferase involved in cell wall biosynthesis
MGKNYALYLGARQAEGDWLLFTDADVRFSPGALKRRLVTP